MRKIFFFLYLYFFKIKLLLVKKGLTALFLFLVIANPFCCCFGNSWAYENGIVENQSCCSSTKEKKDETSTEKKCPSDSGSCGCDNIQRELTKAEKPSLAPSLVADLLPCFFNQSFLANCLYFSQKFFILSAKKQSDRRIIQVNCVYRL